MPKYILLAVLLLLAPILVASEAPLGMKKFNVLCPAKILLPDLDYAYHECSHGFANGSCETFIETFIELLPEYDCQRSFDAAAKKNYIVPAIWLAGSAALEDYVNLLYKLSTNQSVVHSNQSFAVAKHHAKRVFISKEFKAILDGHLSEKYSPLIEKMKKARP